MVIWWAAIASIGAVHDKYITRQVVMVALISYLGFPFFCCFFFEMGVGGVGGKEREREGPAERERDSVNFGLHNIYENMYSMQQVEVRRKSGRFI